MTKIYISLVCGNLIIGRSIRLQQIRLQEIISLTTALIVIRRPDEIHPCSKEEFQSSKINQKGKGRVRQEGRSNGKLSIANRSFASSQISERVMKNFRETCSYDLTVSCSIDHTDSSLIIRRTCYDFSLPRRSNYHKKISTLSSLFTNLFYPSNFIAQNEGGRIYSGFYPLLSNRYEITIITPCPPRPPRPPRPPYPARSGKVRQTRPRAYISAPLFTISHSCFYYQYKTNQIQVAIFLRRLKTTKSEMSRKARNDWEGPASQEPGENLHVFGNRFGAQIWAAKSEFGKFVGSVLLFASLIEDYETNAADLEIEADSYIFEGYPEQHLEVRLSAEAIKLSARGIELASCMIYALVCMKFANEKCLLNPAKSGEPLGTRVLGAD
ncbi:unnamed protein product [Oikopleura dioica]|uniref:Uncharacterized protein n=1 Tax=Oikopleura dioica TaxID=34765 RepID=E4Z121_OIKDI|nr:unnamed protein product [Oikopleura dioica]